MTAPDPTLMEQATIDRTGIFDEEKFAEIIEHAEGSVACEYVGCERTATWRVHIRCCGLGGSICTPHLERGRVWPPEDTDIIACENCGHLFPVTLPFDAVFKVVPL